jgi:hypothetical protein
MARLAKHQGRKNLHLNVKLTGDLVDIWNELVGRLGGAPASQILKEAIRLRALVAIGMSRNAKALMALPTRQHANSALEEKETDIAEFLDLTPPDPHFVPHFDDAPPASKENVTRGKFGKSR